MASKIQENKDIKAIMNKCEYIQNSKIFDKWLKRSKYAEKTSIGYTQGIRLYCEYHEMHIDDLICEHEEELKKGILPADQSIYDRFYDFKEWLEESGKADNTITFLLGGVKSIYRSRRIEIPKAVNNRKIKNTLIKNDYVGFTKKEIRQALQLLNPRNKAILHTIISTGLSKDDLLELPLSIMDEEPDASDGLLPITIIRRKTGVKFTTYLNREAYDSIQNWLKFRTERLRINREKFPEKEIEDNCPYLFVTLYNQIFGKLTSAAYNKIFRDMNNKLGEEYRGEKGQYMKMRGHNFRHFFKTEMQAAGCPSWAVEFFMGHRLKGTDKSYFDVHGKPSELRKLYSHSMHAISINREIEEVFSPEDSSMMKALMEKIEKQDKIINTLFQEVQRLNQDAKRQDYMDDMKKEFYEQYGHELEE